MKAKFFFFLISLLSFCYVNAQNKLLTTEDVVINSYSSLAPQNLKQLNWIANTENFYFITNDADQALVVGSLYNTKVDTLIRLSELLTQLQNYGIKNLSNFPLINWVNSENFTFFTNNKLFSYNVPLKKMRLINQVDENTGDISLSPNKKFIAFTKGNNLFVALSEKNTVQISHDTISDIVNGQAVHRNEFGINSGIFWSPNSNYVAYYRMDQTMVTNYPIVDISSTPAKLHNIKYPMAGQASHHVTIGIYNIKTNETTWLKTGEPLDQYLTCVTWSPDEKYIFVAHLNRDQNHLQLKKYDISSGEPIQILFEEKNDKYVEPLNPLYFRPNHPSEFIWISRRDGYNHLYLYDINGTLIKQVTSGNWEVLDFEGYDSTGNYVYYYSTEISPIERHFYRINLINGQKINLTKEEGIHSVSVSYNGKYFIDNFNNIHTPRVINIIDESGNTLRNLLTSENPLKDYKLGRIRIFKIKNDEGTELYCRMIYPVDFDSTKKYPVIVYVYGGPHAQLVTDSWGYGRYSLWFQQMAEHGYVIFTLDNRGSSNRGLAFEQATFRRLGTIEVKDQMTGIAYLKTLPYIDTTKFGVFGWSFGGFMATSLMLRTNNTFKVGVGGGAVIDWKYYEVMYTERYMDTPQQNPEGYKESSLLNYVQNLKGKLLLVHGTSDSTVVWQHTLEFAKKCADLNIPLDYFPYPGQPHGVTGPDAVHLYNKITNYFLDNL
ncbi:S9 family peptidase [Melioribacteraceae bacterium 4301-Me]|uniref:S9 family peptidase n=1 Tax=Pyranulibacter aquaticus TaxID=3163344 RepID=UPI00359A47B6